jgi:predicted small lipoprotein YifL
MSSRSAIAVVLLTALALAGCGRRGPLEAPGEPETGAVSDTAPRPGSTPMTSNASPGATEPQPAAPGAAPGRRFILDPLI